MREGIIVWDCGATNTTVLLIELDGGAGGTTDGRIAASLSRPTEAVAAEDGLAWPVDDFWRNFCEMTRQLLRENRVQPRAVNVTAFGVCWGAVGADGELLYPVISWKCQRTRGQLEWAERNLDLDQLYRRTGAPPFYFNTAFSLRWMREHRPAALDAAEAFLMMPQLFVERLTGERVSEQTMATTSMLYDLREGGWSDDIFAQFQVPNRFPPAVGCPGDAVGAVRAEAAEATGLPVGTPVCAGGHDTAVAVAGACRDLRRSLLFSTGTWSILVGSRDAPSPDPNDRLRNILWQRNPGREGVLGGFNIQGHMIGGLAYDMTRRLFMPGVGAAESTARAAAAEPGSGGMLINPTFVAGTGPNPQAPSAILGWTDGMPAENAVRAVLEGLAYQTRDSLDALNAKAESLLIGGGFAKNDLFAQILADVTQTPVELAAVPEVTALGAAALAMIGCGAAESAEEAWRRIDMPTRTFTPGENAAAYAELYERRNRAVRALEGA